METNIIVKTAWVIVISAWNTVSVQCPTPRNQSLDADGLPSQSTLAIYYATGYHQSSTVQSNQVMYLEWEGQKKELLLQSINIGTTNRTIYR